ncbi:MAG TPA: lysophospholipid acyltransferase family protein [Acidobacteriaceae bacterium]|nr:lysophospholipid acyltransferase family protein [Acidobacteriaceae bacterium]
MIQNPPPNQPAAEPLGTPRLQPWVSQPGQEDGASAPGVSLRPAPPPTHLRLLTKFLIIPLMAASTAFFGCISLLCGLWDRSGRQQHFVAHVWARTLLRLSFSPAQLIGREHIPTSGSAVYASNHLSYMDTPVLFGKLPFQFRILAKHSLWKIPFVGWYLNRSGQVPIDSRSSRSAVAGLLRGVAVLKSGTPLVVFPEGARSPDGTLHPMASGCAFMAIRAGVPLIPVALIGTYQLLPIHCYTLRPRILKIVIGAPIPTEGLTTKDADSVTEHLYTAITALYHQHS